MTKAMRVYLVLASLALGVHYGGGRSGWWKGVVNAQTFDLRGGGGSGWGYGGGGGGFRGGK